MCTYSPPPYPSECNLNKGLSKCVYIVAIWIIYHLECINLQGVGEYLQRLMRSGLGVPEPARTPVQGASGMDWQADDAEGELFDTGGKYPPYSATFERSFGPQSFGKKRYISSCSGRLLVFLYGWAIGTVSNAEGAHADKHMGLYYRTEVRCSPRAVPSCSC